MKRNRRVFKKTSLIINLFVLKELITAELSEYALITYFELFGSVDLI